MITSNLVVDACGSWPWWGDAAQIVTLALTLVTTTDLCIHIWRTARPR
jgi:hypothetical protein